VAVDAFLGVAVWSNPDWQRAFYPSELPEEWRVAYYGNLFSCVWVDSATWTSLTPETAQFWLNETPERFRFVLEAAEGAGKAEKDPFDGLQAGSGVMRRAEDPSLHWFDAATDMRKFYAVLSESTGMDGEIYLISRDGNLSRVDEVKALLQLLGL
jgi:hypothetical protein